MQLSLEDHINKVLFKADLLNTCCVANDAYDEYHYIAANLHSYIEDNDYTICKEMLEDILCSSLSSGEDDSLSDVVLSDFVSLASIASVITDLEKYLTEHFPK